MTTRKHLEDDSYRDARELNDRGKTERKSLDEEINEWNKRNRGKKDPITGMDLVRKSGKGKFKKDPRREANA